MHFIIGQCSIAFMQYSNIMLTMFLAGLVGSLTHCAGMCGPFVLAQSSYGRDTVSAAGGSGYVKVARAMLFPYHLGRMTTYVLLAVVAAILSKQIMGTILQQSVAFVLLGMAGIIFIWSAIGGLLRQRHSKLCKEYVASPAPPYWRRVIDAVASYLGAPGRKFAAIVAHIAQPFLRDARGWRGYILGVMLGFLPCGLIFAALMAVSTTASPLVAGLAMCLFAVGTMPALILVGMGGRLALAKWPKATQSLAQIVMIANGVSLCMLAGKIVM